MLFERDSLHRSINPLFSPRLGVVVTWGIVMRILSKRQLKEMVVYSPHHVTRPEKAGKFPKRIQLGPNRVGWVESEVLDWLQERMDSPENLTDIPGQGAGWPDVHCLALVFSQRYFLAGNGSSLWVMKSGAKAIRVRTH